jgi:Flp pilus assembly pilin Flp
MLTTHIAARPRAMRGQGMTEYIIIVALISVAAIAVYQLFGQVVRSQTAAMVREIAGEDGSTESKAAQTAASTAKAQAAARSLKSFTGNSALAGSGSK